MATRPRRRLLLAVAIAVLVITVPTSASGPSPVEPQPSSEPVELPTERVAAVTIRVESRGGGVFDTGSGVAIAPRLVLTSGHLVDERMAFASRCAGEPLAVERLLRADDADLALVTVADASMPAVALAEADPVPGSQLVLAGFPGGGDLVLTPVEVHDYLAPGPDGGGQVLRFSPIPVVGQSGGPLLDGEGRLVGIAYAREEVSGLGHAVPATVLRRSLAAILARERPAVSLAGLLAVAGDGPLLRPTEPLVEKAARWGEPLVPLLRGLAGEPVPADWLTTAHC